MGGVCTVCKTILNEEIVGGMSFHEFVRDRGIIPRETSINDMDKAVDAKLLKDDVKGLLRRAIPPSIMPVLATPAIPATSGKAPDAVPAPKGPGMWSKFVGMMKGAERRDAEVPKPETKAPASPPPKGKEMTWEEGRPKLYERWTVGPCAPCSLDTKKTGTVIQRGGNRYAIIKTEAGDEYYGCFLCSKKTK
jgi:hypothetical protein